MPGGNMWLNLNAKLLVVLFFLGGCATYNTATGHNEMIFVNTSQEVSMGRDLHEKLIRQERMITDGPEYDRLIRIANRLARISDRQDYQYHFSLIDKDELNAFTTPGGYVYVYSGLLHQLPTDDAVAAVLAHEIGHCAAKHTVKKFQAALSYDLVRNVLLSLISPEAKTVASWTADGVMNLATSSYGRHDEYEADRLGIKYLYLAGFDLNGMIKVFEVLETNTKGDHMPLILRTHPFLKDRILAAKKEIEAVKGKY